MCCGDHLLRWPFRYGTTKTMSWHVGAAPRVPAAAMWSVSFSLLQLYALCKSGTRGSLDRNSLSGDP